MATAQRQIGILALGILVGVAACGGDTRAPQGGQTAPGADRTSKTGALEGGANAKDDPSMIMESDHYCNQVNEDFAQCVLFDGNGKDARLHGVEYIISAKLYDTLPAAEKMYWHPHNYEILSGELVMPGLPASAEKAALKQKINSYGKTWHFWKTGVHGQKADPLPIGPAHLAWSFNRDGELPPELLHSRDARFGTNTTDNRQHRADLAAFARPQGGVNALAGRFPNAKGAPAGVTDNGDAAARPVPTIGVREAAPKPTGR